MTVIQFVQVPVPLDLRQKIMERQAQEMAMTGKKPTERSIILQAIRKGLEGKGK